MRRKQTTEDYLKTIYCLSRFNEVRGSDIAEALNVSRPTVSVSLKALEKEGYIQFGNSRFIYLTSKGKKIAEEIYERHITFRDFLERIGVDRKMAAEDACRLEHAVSSESFLALKNYIAEKG